ncbi:hypothetical protein DERF_010282 [Dermatophagoides farinae]|uniref:Uncharacterized protein n=1 Tax=Dermatophagoides farinae TaxID=6954 RepID=A0A922HZS6_DERFA|nr:hypothetical protein DERF_010282 [Dermatophagoides farinae]
MDNYPPVLMMMMMMIIIHFLIFKYSLAAVDANHHHQQQWSQRIRSKKFDHHDDGLLVASSLLHRPLSFASSTNEESVLSGLFKRHKNAIMNRNHALISISHPHYSLYFPPYPSYLPQQNDLLMNSLMPFNPSLISVMPEYSVVPPTTTMLQLSPLTMPNYLQHGHTIQSHTSPVIIPNSPIYKNVANSPTISNNVQQFDDQTTQNANDRYRHHHQNNKHKIQIGQKFSQSIYANSHNLRYENPQMKKKPTGGGGGGGSQTLDMLKSEQKNYHQYQLPAQLSSIAKNPYYGVLDDDDDDRDVATDNVGNVGKIKSSSSSLIDIDDSKRQDSKEEKGFF